MLAALLCIVVMFVGEQRVVVGGGEVGSEFEPLNATLETGDPFICLLVRKPSTPIISAEDVHSAVAFYANLK
jgi:hypothetical protein